MTHDQKAPWPGHEDYKETAKWFCWSVLASLMPLWGTMILLKLFSQTPPWSTYYENGEFALYAAGLLAPACFQLFRDLKAPFLGRGWLGFFTVGLLVVATLVFAGVVVVVRLQTTGTSSGTSFALDKPFLAKLSIGTFVCGAILAFWINAVDMARGSYDPKAVDDQQVEDLSEELRKVRRG